MPDQIEIIRNLIFTKYIYNHIQGILKKIASILLIFVFLFNVIGHYAVYAGMLYQAHAETNLKIDNNDYDRSETIIIKIPLTLPYPIQSEFMRITGDFEFQGEFYKLVEQKYENDSVYVVCLKNLAEKRALKVMTDFVKQSADQSSLPHQNSKASLAGLKDYNTVMEKITLPVRESITIAKTFTSINDKPNMLEFPVPTPPPNAIC